MRRVPSEDCKSFRDRGEQSRADESFENLLNMEAKMFWLRELKAEEPPLVVPVYCPSELNTSDTFTKNISTPLFEEHVSKFCTDE